MKKLALLLFGGLLGLSIQLKGQQVPWSGNPLVLGASAIKSSITSGAKSLSDRALKLFDIDAAAMAATVEQMKKLGDKIKKEVSVLQGVVNHPKGPFVQVQKITNTVTHLKKELLKVKDRESFMWSRRLLPLFPYIDTLISQIDALEANPLLKSAQRLLRLFQELFVLVLKLRIEAGKLGNFLISQTAALLLEEGILDLGLLADNLVDFIAGGKRTLKDIKPQLISRLITERHHLPKLEGKLVELQSTIVPQLQKFMLSISSIGAVIVPLALLGTNLRSVYHERIEARREKSYIGLVGPISRYQEIRSIMMQLRNDVFILLASSHDAVEAITDIVELALENFIDAFDKALSFKILKTRAERAARKLPINARRLQEKVADLYKELAAPSRDN